jgi:hypothetical protein
MRKKYYSNHDYRVKMNVINYITITCNLKNGRLQITSDYMKKCNRLQLITITPCLIWTAIFLSVWKQKKKNKSKNKVKHKYFRHYI